MRRVAVIGLVWIGFLRPAVTAASPPPSESLAVTAPRKTLTAIGQTTQLTATARQAGGDTVDVTPESMSTAYRSSNPEIVQVSAGGLCTATGPGTAYITVTHDVSSQFQVDVSVGDPLTTVAGVVQRPGGAPAVGAVVTVRTATGEYASTSTTDATGRFAAEEVPTLAGTLSVSACRVGRGKAYVATVAGIDPVAGTTALAQPLSLVAEEVRGSVIGAGDVHTVALRRDGSLWAWGDNSHGRLGDGTMAEQPRAFPRWSGRGPREAAHAKPSPVRVGRATDWASVAAGGAHTLALKRDGSLWAWGDNSHGQLGLGTIEPQASPVRVGSDADWKVVAAGGSYSLALKLDGSLWAWGESRYGQLGDGTTDMYYKPSPVRVGSATDWMAVAAGEAYSVALRTDGSLWTWGNCEYKPFDDTLKDESSQPFPRRIDPSLGWSVVAAGYGHAVALKRDGSLWAWGRLPSGPRLSGGRPTDDRPSPVRVGSASDWKAVAAGYHHTVALKPDHSLWDLVINSNGTLDDWMTAGPPSPVRVDSAADWEAVAAGPGHIVALKADGSLWAWGEERDGQLGGGTTDSKPSPVRVGKEADWKTMAAGDLHSVAIKTDGSLWEWGRVIRVRFGGSRSEPSRVGDDHDWSTVTAGSSHAAALKTDGSLWEWGERYGDEQGDDQKPAVASPARIGDEANWTAVAAGSLHTLALKADGSLWGWGINRNGQLGDGTTLYRSSPVRIGFGMDWKSIAAEDESSLALKTDGSLWVWGAWLGGVLGGGSNEARVSPERVGLATNWQAAALGGAFPYVVGLKQDGSLWTWGTGNDEDRESSEPAPVRVGSATDWTTVGGGGNSALAMKTNGSLWAWGRNDPGNVGDGTFIRKSTPVRVASKTRWRAVAAGSLHTLALKTDGSLWAWGHDGWGELGDGWIVRVLGGNVWGPPR